MNIEGSDELRDLTEAYVLGTLDPGQMETLETLLLADEDARLFFLASLDVHAGLAWEFRGTDLPLPELSEDDESSVIRPGRWSGVTWRWAVPLAAVIIFLLAMISLWNPTRQAAETLPVFASVKASLHGQWADGREVAVGAVLARGILELQSGLVELETASGTTLLLEAPVRLELHDALHGTLLSGNLVVRMTEGTSGFVVDMPQMRVTDLGTEFGVSVASNGESRVQVFDGEVRAEALRIKDDRNLLAGETLRCTTTGTLASDEFSESRFIRRFPPLKPDEMPGGPLFSKSELDSVRIAVPKEPVIIDGDLSEWNRAGAFRSSCLPPFEDTYFVEGIMMYDAENLYIAAHVGDPEPMRNAARDEMAFAGGSVIVRVSTDRDLGWPLKGTAWRAFNSLSSVTSLPFMLADRVVRTDEELRVLAETMPLADSISDRIANIILSYDAQAKQPRLRLQYGFNSHDNVLDPPGDWQGVFQKDPDGRGYTLEYAIPWELLNCEEDPPQAGDIMSALWMVHWSDAEGRLCRGQLVDVTNHEPHSLSKVPPYSYFLNGPCWGKAIYLPQEE
ncbi:FecR domain-containing protein [Verrucomicrobiaceae bacterium 227]